MEEMNIVTPVKVCTYSELSDMERALVNVAKHATRTSYAPYSRFSVGAAVMLEDGTVVSGSNQENAALPSSMCAERTTVYWASARHPGKKIKCIAIAANTFRQRPGVPFDDCFQPNPIAPCGACRQTLLEYEHIYGPIKVILYGADKTYIVPSVAHLLPITFTEFQPEPKF